MDLQSIFSTVCNMTITASVVIVCVLLARMVLKKAPRGFACALWAVVLFRLLCPVSVSAPVSVLTVVDVPKTQATVSTVVYVESPVQAPVETIRVDPSQNVEPAPPAPITETPIDWHLIASRVWAAGMAVLVAYGIVSYVNLKRKLRESVPIGPSLREADGICSPFLLGLLRPVIYLPSGLRPEERGHILLHEQCHLRHGDHLVKAAFWLAVCIHWFNPLAWLAFILCGRDMEMRCDEAVLRSLGPQIRSDYAQALLNFATGRRMAPAPLAFGEGDTGKRVRHVLTWKQKAAWALIPAAILCAVVLIVTAVNPNVHLAQTQRVFNNRYRADAVLGEQDEWIYYPREFDFQFCCQKDGEQIELGELTERRLGSAFDLADEALEQQLRQENDLAWKTGEYWLLYQKDGSVYLSEGQDRVLRLVRIETLDVRVQTQGDFGLKYPMQEYPIDSVLWEQERHDYVAVSGEATLVWTQSGDDETLTVMEEYHKVGPDGWETVSLTPYELERTRDYGYELPIARRGEYEGDWALYRVDLGLSTHVFYVRFGMETSQPQIVSFGSGGASISLKLPENWSWIVTSLEDDPYSAGITFWPTGREAGVLRFEFYPDFFAVCGTGLETESMTLAGQTATVGTYDGEPLWTFLSFGDHFAVWGENHEAWWAEYGEQAMEIINSAGFGLDRGVDVSAFDMKDVVCTLPVSPTEP